MIKLPRTLSLCFSLGLALFLGGCEKIAILNPKGMVANEEKDLLIICLILMLLVVIPTLILTAVIARKYRASNKKGHYAPNWGHSVLIEIICWTIPIIIIAILATLTWTSSHKLDPYRPLDIPEKPIPIQVIALNWRWLFLYPDQNIATLNFVEFPVNRPIRFFITADAPMNSFQIPALAGQIYAMAGMQTKLNLIANTPGDYRGGSTNYSGDGFANMHFVARVVSAQQFDAWVAQLKKHPHPLDRKAYEALIPNSQDTQVVYYTPIDTTLFDDTLMKYMMPMPKQSALSPHKDAHHA